MDIVDAQVHVGRGAIHTTLAAMDALGITSVLIDEFWGTFPATHPSHIQPGYLLPNGAWRAVWPTAEEASLLHPDRFAYLVRVDPRDPQLEGVMRTAAGSPNARAFRIQPVWTQNEANGFAKGSYDALLGIAEDIGLPVCAFIPGHAELLAPCARRFQKLRFIIDHCGMGFANIPPGRSAAEEARVLNPDYFNDVLKLSDYPNVFMKFSHSPRCFGSSAFPYTELRPHLRAAITAFGADRLIWASDHTVMFGHTWSDLLHAVRDDPELSDTEKQWILGRTARTVFNWPAPPTSGRTM